MNHATIEAAPPVERVRRRKPEELVFHSSPATTLGVELELQILDRETGDLAPGAVRILEACAADGIEGVSAELMQSMLEIKTGVCANVAGVRSQLLPLVTRVRNIATSMGYELAMAGTHPFHRMGQSVVFPDERHQRIQDRLAWMIHQRVVFGLHVHVGMPDGEMAIGVMNALVCHLPHLVALSANSPFWQGIDTGLASCRTALYRSLPHSGVPRYFSRWKDFRNYFRVMRDCEAIQSTKDVYWDVRPRPDFGTIEIRVCDMPPTLATTLGIVALIRTLVISTQRLFEERPQLRRGDMRRHWIAGENKWLATRFGLDAMYVRTPAGKRRPLALDLAERIDHLTPIARESGDYPFLVRLLPIDKFESGADRQRRIYRETGNWKSVIGDLTQRAAEELKATPTASPTQPGERGA
jgi:carboxylate-amine ligase